MVPGAAVAVEGEAAAAGVAEGTAGTGRSAGGRPTLLVIPGAGLWGPGGPTGRGALAMDRPELGALPSVQVIVLLKLMECLHAQR